MHTPASRRGVRHGVLPGHQPRLGDVSTCLRVEAVQIVEESALHLGLRHARQRTRASAAAVDHQQAAVLRRAGGVQRIGVVEEHVEAAVRREQRVDVVPRHWLRLVGEDAEHRRRADRDAIECRRRVTGQCGAEESRDKRRGERENRGACSHGAGAIGTGVLDVDAGACEAHARHGRVESDVRREVAPERLGQQPRATAHVAAEVAAVPDVREERCHRGLRDRIEIAARAVTERLEDALSLRMERPEIIAERHVTAGLHRAQTNRGVRVARPMSNSGLVFGDGLPHLEPGARKRHAATE